MPAPLQVTPRGRAPRVPDAVRQELDRRNALSAGLPDRDLARSSWAYLRRPAPSPAGQAAGAPEAHDRPPAARTGGLARPDRSCRGSPAGRFDALSQAGTRCASAACAGPRARPGPGARARRNRACCRAHGPHPRPAITAPRVVSGDGAVSPLHTRPPDAGECRLWSLLARPALSRAHDRPY